MLRKLISAALFLLMLLPCAHAAQLLEDESVSIPGTAAPAGAVSFTGGDAQRLLDDNAYTCWSRAASIDTNTFDVMLTPTQDELSAIWVRSGNQNSAWDYQAHARPSIIKVDVSYLVQDVLHVSSYRYALTDMFQPEVDSLLWCKGYQCLQLPAAITGVQSITLTVESYMPGTYLDELCISDILLAGPQEAAVSQPQQPAFEPIHTKLLMRMATRSGPSTAYEGLGSYFKEGQAVTALSLCYDNGGTPWVQVEFTYQNRLRRAYTGLKRVDVDESLLPREEWLTDATLLRETTPRFGPGTEYGARNLTLPAGQWGSVYAYENGWAQFEYYDEANAVYRRVWVPADELTTQ